MLSVYFRLCLKTSEVQSRLVHVLFVVSMCVYLRKCCTGAAATVHLFFLCSNVVLV